MHAIAATPNMQVLHLHHLRQLSPIPGNLELHTSALVECRPETPQFFANDASMGSQKRSQLPGNTAFRVSVVFRMRPIIVWKESTRDISKTALNSLPRHGGCKMLQGAVAKRAPRGPCLLSNHPRFTICIIVSHSIISCPVSPLPPSLLTTSNHGLIPNNKNI